MNKKDVDKLLKGLKPHPLFLTLPEELKDQAVYADIEERVAKTMFSDHKHKTVKGFVNCKRCSIKLTKRRELLTEIGFQSTEQYLEWKRVMDIIINNRPIRIS